MIDRTGIFNIQPFNIQPFANSPNFQNNDNNKDTPPTKWFVSNPNISNKLDRNKSAMMPSTKMKLVKLAVQMLELYETLRAPSVAGQQTSKLSHLIPPRWRIFSYMTQATLHAWVRLLKDQSRCENIEDVQRIKNIREQWLKKTKQWNTYQFQETKTPGANIESEIKRMQKLLKDFEGPKVKRQDVNIQLSESIDNIEDVIKASLSKPLNSLANSNDELSQPIDNVESTMKAPLFNLLNSLEELNNSLEELNNYNVSIQDINNQLDQSVNSSEVTINVKSSNDKIQKSQEMLNTSQSQEKSESIKSSINEIRQSLKSETNSEELRDLMDTGIIVTALLLTSPLEVFKNSQINIKNSNDKIIQSLEIKDEGIAPGVESNNYQDIEESNVTETEIAEMRSSMELRCSEIQEIQGDDYIITFMLKDLGSLPFGFDKDITLEELGQELSNSWYPTDGYILYQNTVYTVEDFKQQCSNSQDKKTSIKNSAASDRVLE